jgi:cation diffusion facilitator family transporter
VVADGLESAGDVLSSGFVLFGLSVAARPADEDHPYGHGRFEILIGLLIGLVLTAGGVLICYFSLRQIGRERPPLAPFLIWPPILSMVAKTVLAAIKFRHGRHIGSAALTADAWNDAMDTLSALAALVAVSLTLSDPVRFAEADLYGGCAVGLIIVFAGLRVSRETSLQLMDTMPAEEKIAEIRSAAMTVEGVSGVEKCFARKTGLKYHVDLHLEVDPEMTVRRSHHLGHEVRERIMQRLPWVADVLVHVEPSPFVSASQHWRISPQPGWLIRSGITRESLPVRNAGRW